MTGTAEMYNLITLNCSGNPIAKLDVDGCDSFQSLTCDDCMLGGTLALDAHERLRTLSARHTSVFSCTNNIASIDITG